MTPMVEALSKALDNLRQRLYDTPRTTPGFGEMRALQRELTRALIDAADKAELELASKIESVSGEIVEEWQTNVDKLKGWEDLLRPVVKAVSAITDAAILTNPLTALLG